jgi:lipopolysaccharide/colanic/teichoic acid biosynthesis glycosyltransferase
MLKLKSKQILLFLGDIVLAVFSLYGALALRFLDLPDKERTLVHIELFAPLIVLSVILYYSFDFYEFSPFHNKLKTFSRVINIHVFVALIGFVFFYLFPPEGGFTPKTVLVLYTALEIMFTVVWRIFFMPRFLRPALRAKTLLIAEGNEYEELKHIVNGHAFYPFYFTSHLTVSEEDVANENTALTNLKHILEKNDIVQVVIDIRDPKVTPLLSYLYNLASQRKIHVFDAGMVYQDVLKKMPMRGVGHFWFFESVHLNIKSYEAIKRVVDIALALPWLMLWALLHPFVALAIRLDSKGEIFIAQERFGFGGKIIKLYKYRTMAFSDKGKWLKDKDNKNKVTRVGVWLRKSRIDELPQLLAILQGDLSFIGPRPDIIALGGQLSAQIPFYMMRYTIRPGLSGWAQVNQELPPQSLEETKVRLQYDLYYVKNRSFFLDFIIMVKTFKVLVLRTGM